MNRFLLCCITIEKPCHCQELVAVVNETLSSSHATIQVTPIITINLDKNQVHRNLTGDSRKRERDRERYREKERAISKWHIRYIDTCVVK